MKKTGRSSSRAVARGASISESVGALRAKRETKKQRADTDIIMELLSALTNRNVLALNPRRARASFLLMVAKLQDKDVLKDDSLIRAKMAAKVAEQTGSFYSSLGLVLLAIVTNDKRFFVDFGKCLSGEIKDPTLFDNRDRDIAEIVLFNPRMSAKQAVLELEKRGHHGITEESFRMWKMRLLRAKPRFDAVMAAHVGDLFTDAEMS
jgi:hypothetical protein